LVYKLKSLRDDEIVQLVHLPSILGDFNKIKGLKKFYAFEFSGKNIRNYPDSGNHELKLKIKIM